jgi:hypothetical protein
VVERAMAIRMDMVSPWLRVSSASLFEPYGYHSKDDEGEDQGGLYQWLLDRGMHRKVQRFTLTG